MRVGITIVSIEASWISSCILFFYSIIIARFFGYMIKILLWSDNLFIRANFNFFEIQFWYSKQEVPFSISSFCWLIGSSLISFTSSSVDKCIFGGTKTVEGKWIFLGGCRICSSGCCGNRLTISLRLLLDTPALGSSARPSRSFVVLLSFE